MADNNDLDFYEWLSLGIENGWCGPAVCLSHDGVPTSQEEDESMEEGNDDCLHIIRLYADADHKNAVEENHPPSVWRK